MVAQLEGQPDTPCLRVAATAAWSITGVMRFEPPSWTDLARGARPAQYQPEDFEPGASRGGWQQEAACRIEQRAQDNLLLRLPESGKALLRSHGGPGAGLAFTTCPTCRITKKDPHVFRVLLLRHLHLPLPWTLHRLPVWPPTRFSWPPPCSLCSGWGLWEYRLRPRECRSPHLPGSRWQGVNQRDGARSGFGAVRW